MRLALLQPEILSRSCDQCEAYQYEDAPGEMGPLMHYADGRPLPRAKGVPTPCHQCPKVPSEKRVNGATRRDAIEPSDKSWDAYQHYLKCKTVGRFPEDEIAENNAVIIATVERGIEQARQADLTMTLAAIARIKS